MSSSEYNRSTAPEILQLNMENISKELNDLIVNCEPDIFTTQQFPMELPKTAVQPLVVNSEASNNSQIPNYISNAFYGHHQQLYGATGLENVKHNLNCFLPYHQPVSYGCVNNVTTDNLARTSNCLTPPSYMSAGERLNHYTLSSAQPASTSATSAPSYEFHYLRSHGENVKNCSYSMSPSAGQGAVRKISKLSQKHFYHKTPNIAAANEDTNFDLSTIDFLKNDKEISTVQRLFNLLRDLHCAVDETQPSTELNSYSQYEETFAPCITKTSSMSATLNVQNQVKQACRKLAIFTYEMQRVLSANKMFEAEMNAECDFYLNQLRQYLNQMELYKRMVMEHKHGKFLREEVNVHAERLSLLLEHINRQIREVYVRILAVDWYIGVKYRGDVKLSAAMPLSTENDKEVSNKSKTGVINEILQMCNTTTTDESTKVQTETTKTETVIKSPTKLINNEEVVNLKPLLNKNEDILNIYKPEQIKRMVHINSGSNHTRQPVFYIG